MSMKKTGSRRRGRELEEKAKRNRNRNRKQTKLRSNRNSIWAIGLREENNVRGREEKSFRKARNLYEVNTKRRGRGRIRRNIETDTAHK